MLVKIFIFFVGLLLFACGNNTKYWIHSNNWSNPKKWDFSPNPCDAVTLPDLGYDYSVLVSNHAKLHSLEFPSTGEIVFGDRASVSLSSLGTTCSTPIGNTYRTQQYSWGDPNNWYTEPSSDLFDTADSDKIPCLTDTVVFNETVVYNVLVDQSVEVGALHIGDEVLNTDDVRDYTAGPGRAQLQFINLAELVVTGRTVCTNPEGCLCGNQLDCSLVQCPRQHCVKPIRSKGICCHYCGAEVRFSPPPGFYLMKFKESLEHFMKKQIRHIDDTISTTVSLQEIDQRLNIQITVSDSITDGSYEGAGYESSKIAQQVYDYIVEYYIGRASDLIISQSHQPYLPDVPEAEDVSASYTGGIESWVLYVVLSVSLVLLLVIIFLLYKCSQRYRDNAGPSPQHIRLDHGSLPRTLASRYKPCVPSPDQDIPPTYDQAMMETMLAHSIAPDQTRDMRGNHDNMSRPGGNPPPHRQRGAIRDGGYNEIPTTDISDHSRV